MRERRRKEAKWDERVERDLSRLIAKLRASEEREVKVTPGIRPALQGGPTPWAHLVQGLLGLGVVGMQRERERKERDNRMDAVSFALDKIQKKEGK